jgi:hypothetical protein
MGWTVRGSNPGRGEIFRTRPDLPWGPPSLLYNGYRVSISEVKRPGCGVNHPHPSSAEVKERVDLYLYSPFGPSGTVLGGNVLLPAELQGVAVSKTIQLTFTFYVFLAEVFI